MVFFVETDVDSRVELDALELIVGQRQILQLVEGIGGVGDELAQEYLAMRVERVNDQMEELAHLCLKLML